jgi:D-sedoheptulose 7-phosphate isomerase
MRDFLSQFVDDACRTFQSLKDHQAVFDQVAAAAVRTLQAGGKILTCGNGGSAADALHLAEELVGRYRGNRRPLPAISLNADPTLLTCLANDFGFDEVFARQVEALAEPRDLLVVFSSSGNSPNVTLAVEAARRKGCRSVAFLGKDGGATKGKADWELIVASHETARIQEAHTLLLHALLEVLETELGLHR